MKTALLAASIMVLGTCSIGVAETPRVPTTRQETDWPSWRGPELDGVVPSSANPPTSWSETENIKWQRLVAGRGHGSPTVLGPHVYLPIADSADQTQSVACFDRETGRRLWRTLVHEGGFKNSSERQPNERASLASSTIASNGEFLFINFLNDDAVWTTALDLDGEIAWQQRICDYILHQGYGSSPVVSKDLVIVSADNKAGGVIVGLEGRTGEVVWKHDRPQKPNYSSPIILNVAEKTRVIMTGCDLVTSLDPQTGQVDWEVEGATTECVTSTVTDGKHVFSSGGYPSNHIAAYDATDGTQVWEVGLRAYVPSLIHRDGFLFAVLDAGIVTCLESATGDVQWRKRLGGTFNSSPVLVDDRIYVTSEEGVTHIFAASPDGFEVFAENELGTSVFATPAFSGDQIFMRVARYENDRRQEYLVCIEE